MSRFSWVESHPLDDDVVVFFVVVVVVVVFGVLVVVFDGVVLDVCEDVVDGTKLVQVTVVPVDLVSKLSSGRSISLSKSSSSPLISWDNHVSSTIVPVRSRTTHVVSRTSPLREKLVPIVSLENDLRSYKSPFAAVGLIKR